MCSVHLRSAHAADLHHSLEWLSLQGCPAVSSRGLEPLQSCHKLSYVDLSGTSVVSLQSLSECMSLRRLRLSGCARLADGALHSLTGLPALGDLDLRGSKHLITATLLNDLAHLPGVQVIPWYLPSFSTLRAKPNQQRDSLCKPGRLHLFL